MGEVQQPAPLLSYVLDITQIDPIKYALQFERFLTKGGKGYPDIDFDVEEPMELKAATRRGVGEDWGQRRSHQQFQHTSVAFSHQGHR